MRRGWKPGGGLPWTKYPLEEPIVLIRSSSNLFARTLRRITCEARWPREVIPDHV